MSSLLVKTAIWGYHVYRVVWEPRVGESFVVLHESGNDNDRHTMAIYRDEDPELPWDFFRARYRARGDSSSASQLDALGGVARLSVGTALNIAGTLMPWYSKATLQNSR